MSENDTRATSVGQTGGLPGANADPRAAELPDDVADDTIMMADVAPPDAGGAPGRDDEPEDTEDLR